MGYETKVKIGIKYEYSDRIGMLDVVEIDLCCCGERVDKEMEKNIVNTEKEVCYGFSNEEIMEDCYGNKIRMIEPDKLLKILKKEQKIDFYGRFDIAIKVINAVKKSLSDTENLICFIYNH